MAEEDRRGEPKGLHELMLASLLYEIGRFRKRATGDPRLYQEVGREWLEGMNLGEVLQPAEEHRELIAEAAALAAGGKLPGEPEGDEALRPLVSVFSRAFLPSPGKERVPYAGGARFYPLRELGYAPDACPYPQESETVARDDYRRLWEAFEREIQAFRGLPPVSYILLVLERYASFIPHFPSGPEGPRCDLSLFDQARATAAIAACLYQRIVEEEEGDFSLVDDRSDFLPLADDGAPGSGSIRLCDQPSPTGSLFSSMPRVLLTDLYRDLD